jgi:hypothetical protein
MSDLYFTQTKLSMLSKSGAATPDADGYYEIVVGALNVHNNTGSWYYTAQGVMELFGPGSLLHRKIANGALRAEVGHPTQQNGETMEQFLQRLTDIDLRNVCAHFKDVWIDKDFGKNNPQYKNPDMIAIIAKVKPVEPYGHILKAALENPKENVCFSIRALATQNLVRGKLVRTITEVITFDLVNEGGVLVASKWDSPATETARNSVETEILTPVTKEALQRISSKAKTNHVFSLESAAVADYILNKHFREPAKKVYQNW